MSKRRMACALLALSLFVPALAQADIQVTEAYRSFIYKNDVRRDKKVAYYDNVYAVNHGEYLLQPFSADVPAEYFVDDGAGAYALSPIVLDVTDAMRARLYGADVGETALYYGQYCERVENRAGDWGFSGIHEGIDFRNAAGCDVYAILGGEVLKRGGDKDGTVAIYNADYDVTVLYLHVRDVPLKIGQVVQPGERIGCEGDKGSGSEYTHVEVRKGEQKWPNAYRNAQLESDDPYAVMIVALNLPESTREPITARAAAEAEAARIAAEEEAARIAAEEEAARLAAEEAARIAAEEEAARLAAEEAARATPTPSPEPTATPVPTPTPEPTPEVLDELPDDPADDGYGFAE